MKKQIFKVQNVKCGGCANTLTTKLKSEFGEIEVNLEVMPREISLEIEDTKVPALREALKSLGYPMADETLGFVENTTAQAKSFVSCAVGKFEVAKGK
ncbi:MULTISPECIES: heavy-metal-associated domain-containing protein [Sulfurimonas]|uniref:heavy-metal-associated domain-containing protein n=1 Tax=Sulfurimonas TaxID=202746 RepID=UPI001264F7EA|nr:heavy-metal-associated domain-containing protein [Sulfurimonas indica]